MKTEVVIIGGGAAGLCAGAILSQKGIPTVIIEKNPRLGKKLLSTGNGRCNLGHSPLEISAYHGDTAFAKAVFDRWTGSKAFFKTLNLITREDSEGRLYPYSNTANSVLDALRIPCENAPNTTILTDTPCENIVKISGKKGDLFLINDNITTKTIIWACGNNNPSTLESLGHSITPFSPALCPIIVDKAVTRPLKGIRIRCVCKAILIDNEEGEKVIASDKGEVQFNEGSLSGICIMNLSHLVSAYPKNLVISLDIAPEFTTDELNKIPLTGLFHSRIANTLKNKPVETIKDWRFDITGISPKDKAQVMSGGIPSSELDLNLSSKFHPNLKIIGEAINVYGDCGGYNLEWCWATANIAVNDYSSKRYC